MFEPPPELEGVWLGLLVGEVVLVLDVLKGFDPIAKATDGLQDWFTCARISMYAQVGTSAAGGIGLGNGSP